MASATAPAHPEPPKLRAFALGLLDPLDIAAVAEHLGNCPSCRRLLDDLPGDWLTSALSQAAQGSAWPTQGQDGLPFSAGLTIKHYRLLERIGQGGMGAVFLAYDDHLRRPVALKFPHPELALSTAFRDRFFREAQIMARLGRGHPAFVSVYEIDQAEGHLYLAMEYLHGQTLEARLREQSPLPLAETLHIARELAEGLAHAHAQEVVHRDIKPSNIWLQWDVEVDAPHPSVLQPLPEKVQPLTGPETPTASFSTIISMAEKPLPHPPPPSAPATVPPPARRDEKAKVKILDFGLAKPLASDQGLTANDTILGTPGYMAPEQARGAAATPRSDLFSLGVVLYRMLTGNSPFQKPTAAASLAAILEDHPPPPHTLNPKIPAPLSALVMRLLDKDAQHRPVNVTELLPSLEERPKPFSQPAPSRKKVIGMVAGLGLALVLGLVLYFATRSSPPEKEPGPSPDNPSAGKKTPDKKTEEKKPEDKKLDGKKPDPKIETPSKAGHVWSREMEILFPEALFSPAGEHVLTKEGPDLLVTRALSNGKEVSRDLLPLKPATPLTFSRDGLYLLFGTFEEKQGRGRLLRKTDKGWKELAWETPPYFEGMQFLGKSNKICTFHTGAKGGKGFCQLFFWTPQEEKVREEEKERWSRPDLARSCEVTPDGMKAVLGFGGNKILVWNLDQNAIFWDFPKVLEHPRGTIDYVKISPDGAHFAVAMRSFSYTHVHLFRLEPPQEVGVLKGHNREITSMAFSPDSTKILTASEDQSIRLWDLKTGMEIVKFMQWPEPEKRAPYPVHLSFSPDGAYALSHTFKKVSLWRLPEK